jgi:hypothetical protein
MIKLSKADEIQEFFDNEKIHDLIIKNESLNEGLLNLSTKLTPLFFDQNKVVQFLRKTDDLKVYASDEEHRFLFNMSKSVNTDFFAKGQVKLDLIKKERLLYNLYP